MGDIYRCSSQVLTWLGIPDSQNTNRDIEHDDRNLDAGVPESRIIADESNGFRRACERPRLTKQGCRAKEEAIQLLIQLLAVDYSVSLWIIQEVCLAPRLQLLFGTDLIPRLTSRSA